MARDAFYVFQIDQVQKQLAQAIRERDALKFEMVDRDRVLSLKNFTIEYDNLF